MVKYKYSFFANIQGTRLPMMGNSLDEIQSHCVPLVAQQGSVRVDTILIDQKGKAEQKLYNARSYWTSADEVCKILSAGISSDIPSVAQQKILALKGKYRIQAVFQGEAKTFIVNDNDGLKTQCSALLGADPSSKMDTVTWAYNGTVRQSL